MTDYPRDNLYRAMQGGLTSEDGRTLTVRLAPHDQWAEIQSVTEGHFMERFTKTAYRKTLADHLPKILFNHGKDPQIGEKPISTTDEAGVDEISPFARGQILDGLPELVVDGLRKGVYGASHRFSVVRESWVDNPLGGAHNPGKLPERTITEAQLFELGPVTWPAYAQASASLRSVTDEYREPVAPSLDAEPEAAHLEPERRDEPVTIAATITKERSTVEYVTRDEKSSRVTELKAALARQAIEYPGVLPNDAQATWDSDTSELDTLERDIAAWDTRQAKLAAYAQDPNKVERSYEPVASFARKTESDIFDPANVEPFRYRSTDQWAGAQRDYAMRAAEQAIFPQPNVDQGKARAGVQSMLDNIDTQDKQLARRVLATGSPIYRRAFSKLAAGLPLTAEEQRGTSLVVGTDNNGGHAIPFAFDPSMIHIGAWTWVNGIRANATIKQIVGTDTWHGVTVAAVTATRGAESTEQAEQGPAFEQVEILANRVSAFVSYSIEMGQDRPDLGSELASLIAEAKDTEEESSFTLGTGAANTPLGIMPAHGTSGMFTNIDLIADHTLTAANAYAMEAALPIRHRQNAVWFMGRAMIRAWQALETTGGQLFGGQYYNAVSYPRNSAVGATGLELLRYPIIEAPSAETAYAGAGDDLHVITLLADIKAGYTIVDRVGMNVEFVPHLFHADGKLPIGVRGLYAMWRNGASVVNVDAGRLLISTSA